VTAGNSGAPLPVGTSAEEGEYTVTAVDADVSLTVDMAAAGAPEPTNGRYVVVELSATYNGADTGDVHMDLLTGWPPGRGQSSTAATRRAAAGPVDGRAGARAG